MACIIKHRDNFIYEIQAKKIVIGMKTLEGSIPIMISLYMFLDTGVWLGVAGWMTPSLSALFHIFTKVLLVGSWFYFGDAEALVQYLLTICFIVMCKDFTLWP
jgi:hypothetical protein